MHSPFKKYPNRFGSKFRINNNARNPDTATLLAVTRPPAKLENGSESIRKRKIIEIAEKVQLIDVEIFSVVNRKSKKS